MARKKQNKYPGLYLNGNLYWVKFRLPDVSKPLYQSLGTKDKNEAIKKYLQLKYQISIGEYSGKNKNSLHEFYEAYKQSLYLTKKYRTADRYCTSLLNFMRYADANGLTSISDVSYKEAVAYRDHRIQIKKPWTVCSEITALNLMFEEARKQGLIKVSPFKELQKPKIIKKPVRYFTDDELQRIFSNLTDQDLLEKIQFLLNTGCRCGEMLALEKDDINFIEGYFDLNIKPYWQPKNSHFRRIYMNDTVRAILHDRCNKSDRWLFLPTPVTANDLMIFGKLLKFEVKVVSRKFRRLLKKAVVFDASLHCLRKTFGCKLYAQTKDIVLVMKVLGHSSWDVSKHYITVNEGTSKTQLETLHIPF